MLEQLASFGHRFTVGVLAQSLLPVLLSLRTGLEAMYLAARFGIIPALGSLLRLLQMLVAGYALYRVGRLACRHVLRPAYRAVPEDFPRVVFDAMIIDYLARQHGCRRDTAAYMFFFLVCMRYRGDGL